MSRSKIIRQLIKDSGMSLKAFSEKAGVPYTTLHSILDRGIGNSSVDNVIKICKVTELEDKDIITLAAHRSGHEGELSEDDMNRIKLAIQIALAKNNK